MGPRESKTAKGRSHDGWAEYGDDIVHEWQVGRAWRRRHPELFRWVSKRRSGILDEDDLSDDKGEAVKDIKMLEREMKAAAGRQDYQAA